MSEGEAAASQPGFLSILRDVFIAPGDAFRAVAARPRWEAPLVLAIAMGLAFTAVWISKADPVEFIRTQMEESGAIEQFPAYQRGRVVDAQARWFQAYAWVVPLFVAPLGYVSLAAVFLVLYRFFYAAHVAYAQSLAVVVWCFAAVHLLLDPLILTVMALKNEWSVDPQSVVQASAAALLDRGTTSKPLYALAGSLDLFSFWTMALLSIGYGAVIGRPAVSAAWAVLTLWALYLTVKVAMAAVLS